MDELEKILMEEMYPINEKILNWWKEHKDDPVFFTEEGKKLKNHLGAIIKNHALAFLMMSIIELEEALAKETSH